jgi:hypothetical protein
VAFDIIDQLLVRFFFAFFRYWREKWELNETLHQASVYFNKAYDSVRMEVLYNIFIVFGVSMKHVRLIKIFYKLFIYDL